MFDYTTEQPLWLGKWKVPQGWTRPMLSEDIEGCNLPQEEIERLWLLFEEERRFEAFAIAACKLFPVADRVEGEEAPPCGACRRPRTWQKNRQGRLVATCLGCPEEKY